MKRAFRFYYDTTPTLFNFLKNTLSSASNTCEFLEIFFLECASSGLQIYMIDK